MVEKSCTSANANHSKRDSLIHSSRWAILIMLAWVVSSGALTARCQDIDPLNSIGVPTYSTNLPVENGYINAATGNLHLEIPLGTFPQRGGPPFKPILMYDSDIWTYVRSFVPYNIPMPWFVPNQSQGESSLAGWRFVIPQYNAVYFDYNDSTSTCNLDGLPYYETYVGFTWYAPDGTVHAFPITTKQGVPNKCNNYNPPGWTPNGSGPALDSSGYSMFVTNYTDTTVYAPDGTMVESWKSNAVEDANGNEYTTDSNNSLMSHGNPIDTLGRTLVKVSGSGNTFYFDVLNEQGGSNQYSRYTVTTETFNVNTNFGGGAQYTGAMTAIQSIALPDGTSYSFQYDSGTAAGHYGLISAMTLPTGGQIAYTFINNPDIIGNFTGRLIGIRNTPDSATPWTYSYYDVPGTCQNYEVNCQIQTTVTKPSGDHTLYTFTLDGGAWPTEAQYYDASSNLVATINQTFNTGYVCGSETGWACEANNAMYVTKASSTTTLPIPGGTNVNQTTQYAWDDPNFRDYGNILKKSEWNFYTGNLPTTADCTTTYTYLNGSSYISAGIVNRPTGITVTNGSGATVAQTNYCYDYAGGCGGSAFGNAGTITNHDTNYSTSYTVRGDLTQAQKLVSGSTFLTKSMTYDTAGQLLSKTDWTNLSTHTTTYSYADNFYNDAGDGSNPALNTSNPATGAYPTTITYPTVNSVTLTETSGYYWGTGQKALSTDVANNETTYFHFYDPLNRPTSTKFPNLYNGSCCAWTYAVYPNASETQADTSVGITSATRSITCTGTLGDCRHDQKQLDGLGRVSSQILVSDPDNQTTVGTTYDLNGRVSSVSNPHRSNQMTTDGTEYYFYDGLDRIKQVTRADGGIAYISYGALIGSNGRTSQLCSGFGVGYPVLYKDEAARLRQTWTDGFGRLIEVDEPDTSSGSLTSGSPYGTCYSYDLNNNLTGVTQGSQTRSFSYDMLSRLTEASNPESGTVCYYYTTSGGTCGVPSSGTPCSGDLSAVCRRTDARSKTTTYAYDALNRLISKSYSDTTPGVAYGYDAVAPSGCTPPTLTITNGKGRRTSMCDGPGATSWSYDPVGNAVTEKRTTNSVTDSFVYSYNLDSTMATVGYPSGRTITYQPGGAQRPFSAEDVTNGINYGTGAHYAPPGELASLTNGGSIFFTALTNPRLQPCWQYATTGTALPWSGSGVSCIGSATHGTVLDLQYSFGSSNNGNVLGITNNRDTTRSESFTYDWLNRITTGAASTYATSPSHCWGETYTIDRYGNLSAIGSISSAYNGCTQDNLSISVSTTTNQITTSGFSYDLSGDLTNDGTHSPTYDAEGHMISDAGVTYYYDADGKRVQKSSGTLYWYGTSSDPLLETNASGGLVNEYIFFGGKRISRRDSSNNIEYYFADEIGSARVVTNASGTILEDCDYFPYGGSGCVPSSVNNYLFTGKERDSESGLDNFGARYDSSQYGRFMTPDPMLNSGRPNNPQTWNRYAYALNNPIIVTDPTGLYNLLNSCAADDAKCNKQFNQEAQNLKNAITALTNAVNNLQDGDQKTALQGALNAFGTENDLNNVDVQFGKNADGAAASTVLYVNGTAPGVGFTVTFDPNQNKGKINQAINAAHEGTHIADESDPRFADSATTLSPFSMEYRGYRTSAYAAAALGRPSLSYGKNGQYPIWNGSWGAVDRNLTNYITTFRDKNGQPDHPETTPHDPWSK